MKHLDDFGKKAQIDYPCLWVYKVIGRSRAALETAVSEIVKDKPYRITPSNTSRSKKYIALNLEITVENEVERNTLYTALKHRAEINMVL